MALHPTLGPRRLRGFLAFLLAAPLVGATAIPDGWFVWPALEPVAGSALDVSRLNPVPAGTRGRIAAKDGHFALPDGERVRFWGLNLQSQEAFPSATEAEALARRLAKGGVNIVRLHHLDNPWGIASGGSIWRGDRGDHLEVDPQQLDKLHRLMAVLKAHGIYTNINLKCSKTLVPADGFPPTVTQLPDFQKRVDLFDRRMIELQKEYARQVLTPVNPYTGLSPIADPAVAVIEINNENSTLGYFTRDLGRGLERLPEPFRGELQQRWNAWLAQRYAGDEVLAQAWNQDTGPTTAASLLAPEATWGNSVQPGSAATLAAGADATSLQVDVQQTSGVAWHVQLSLRGLQLDEGAVYTVAFEAHADKPRRLEVGVGIDGDARPDEDWRSFGLLDTVQIGPDWTPVRLVFPAHSVAGAPAAFSLNVAQETGTIRIRNLSLRAGSEEGGLRPDQSPRSGSVPFPSAPTTRQWADWIHFLADTDRAFADEMRSFLRHDLGVNAPIVCSQLGFGGITALWRELGSDFADAHSYWQHPDFPGGGFDRVRWTIRNSPQIAAFADRSFGELGTLAFHRMAGRPFALSEYDHAWPSDFACEMYPTLAVFACRQDWDAIYPYTSGPYGRQNPDRAIRDYFDQLNHPAKWGLGPWATLVFRRGLIEPAPATAILQTGSPPWGEQPHADLLWRRLIPTGPIDFLNTRFATAFDEDGDTHAARVVRNVVTDAPPARMTRTARGPAFIVAAGQAAVVSGFVGGTTLQAGPMKVECAPFGRDFATIAAVALDGRPLQESHRVLLTVVARAENQGMGWNENRTTVGARWGHGPPIVERVPATITLAGPETRVVHALAPDGARAQRIAARTADGLLTFAVGPGDRTLHYEITTP